MRTRAEMIEIYAKRVVATFEGCQCGCDTGNGNFEVCDSCDAIYNLRQALDAQDEAPADALQARIEELEAALKECYSCIEDGKPSHALDVIDKLFPYTPKEVENES